MPVAMSTSFTTVVSLPLDQDIPESERPGFIVRFVSAGQERELRSLMEYHEGQTFDEYIERLSAWLAPLIVGTVNFPNGSVSGAEAVATLVRAEIRDLCSEIIQATTLGYLDLKKSKSRRQSTVASSVAAAEASAGTPPTNSAGSN